MRTLKFASLLLLIAVVFASCSKEGPAGPAGTNGTNGTNGHDGNANVMIFGYPHDTLNAANYYFLRYVPEGLTAGLIDSSAIFAYYSAGGGQWNIVNGSGPTSEYNTVLYTDPQPYIGIYLRNPDDSYYTGSDVYWDSIRIVIIPAMVFKQAQAGHVDFNNYQAVKAFAASLK